MITALTRIGWYATFALMCTYTAGLAHLSAPAPKRAARQAVQAPAAQPDTAVSPWICCRADLQVIHIHTSTPITKATIEMACIENASAAGVPACRVCSLPPSAVRLPGMTAASSADGAVVASPIASSHSANPYAPHRDPPLARRKHPHRPRGTSHTSFHAAAIDAYATVAASPPPPVRPQGSAGTPNALRAPCMCERAPRGDNVWWSTVSVDGHWYDMSHTHGRASTAC